MSYKSLRGLPGVVTSIPSLDDGWSQHATVVGGGDFYFLVSCIQIQAVYVLDKQVPLARLYLDKFALFFDHTHFKLFIRF